LSSVTRVKVCCIASVAEARLAVQEGAAALGLVSAMPSGPGPIDEAEIAAIAPRVPPGVTTLLLTSRTDPDAIIDQQRRCGVSGIQLCDRLESGAHRELRRAMPGIRLVQVVHVTGRESIDEALSVAPEVDALLLDSGRLDAPVKELGGTGRVHDWTVSRAIRDAAPVPVFLAGGLNPENVGEAIAAVRPYAVDLCTGIRIDGQLDKAKLVAFMRCVRRALA
jgi:phosphoribosylanthranilate isomerase